MYPLWILAIWWQSSELLMSLLAPTAIFLWLYGSYFLPFRRLNGVLFSKDEPRNQENQDRQLTLMTFNIWWESRSQETARVPLQLHAKSNFPSPDIVALQELMPEMSKMMQEELADRYPYHLTSANQHTNSAFDEDPYRLGIFSRYPLTALDASHLADPDFRIQIVRVQGFVEPFLLYNIHPRATNIFKYRASLSQRQQDVLNDFDQRYNAIRRMLSDIRQREEPVVVTGDFNSTSLSDVYRLISTQLLDTHRVAGWGTGFTFPAHAADLGNVPFFRRIMRLDMIFCTYPWTIISSRVGNAHGESDHHPVVAEIQLGQPNS